MKKVFRVLLHTLLANTHFHAIYAKEHLVTQSIFINRVVFAELHSNTKH